MKVDAESRLWEWASPVFHAGTEPVHTRSPNHQVDVESRRRWPVWDSVLNPKALVPVAGLSPNKKKSRKCSQSPLTAGQ